MISLWEMWNFVNSNPIGVILVEIAFLVFVYYLIRKKPNSVLSASLSFKIDDELYDIILPIILALAIESPFVVTRNINMNPVLVSVFGFLLSVVLAPVAEEVMWRGVFFAVFICLVDRYVKSRYVRHIWYISFGLINAVFFMLFHSFKGITIFIVGLLACGLYLWRRSLVPSIVFHFVSNMVIWGVFVLS